MKWWCNQLIFFSSLSSSSASGNSSESSLGFLAVVSSSLSTSISDFILASEKVRKQGDSLSVSSASLLNVGGGEEFSCEAELLGDSSSGAGVNKSKSSDFASSDFLFPPSELVGEQDPRSRKSLPGSSDSLCLALRSLIIINLRLAVNILRFSSNAGFSCRLLEGSPSNKSSPLDGGRSRASPSTGSRMFSELVRGPGGISRSWPYKLTSELRLELKPDSLSSPPYEVVLSKENLSLLTGARMGEWPLEVIFSLSLAVEIFFFRLLSTGGLASSGGLGFSTSITSELLLLLLFSDGSWSSARLVIVHEDGTGLVLRCALLSLEEAGPEDDSSLFVKSSI